MRLLIDPAGGTPGVEVDDAALEAAYAVPAGERSWLRANMVSTVDGAAAGADGRSGSINNAADHRVFALLRRTCDAIVVGAGTARDEGYGGARSPIVLVSRRGEVPSGLRGLDAGQVLMATTAAAPALAETRSLLGDDQVLVLGRETVDLARLRPALAERGLVKILCEGGPGLLRDLLAAGAVDELCLTVVPAVIAGEAGRITSGPGTDVPMVLRALLEEDGTLLSRWWRRA